MPTEKEYLAKKSLLATKQDKLTAGANITINSSNVISATGGGSQVSVTQKVAQGENIADITIDGITTRLYASAGMDGNAVYTGTSAPAANIGEDGDLYYQYEIEQGQTITEIVWGDDTNMPYTSVTDASNCSVVTVGLTGGYGASWFQTSFDVNIDEISTDSQDPSDIYSQDTYDGWIHVYCYNDNGYLNFSYTFSENAKLRGLSFIEKDTYKKTAIYTKDNDVWEKNTESGGGGGSTVTITPTLATGTKIADYSIDGTSGELYAPTGGSGTGNVDDVYVNGTSVLDSNHIAQIKSYKELTQAEYDALPSSKLTDNIMYCITDAGVTEGDTFAPIIYSLEEREVGTWTDGKPLYQKTFSGSWNISDSWIDTGENIPNGVAIKSEAIAYETDGNNVIQILSNISPNNGNIWLYSLRSGATYHVVCFTVWYTKTTDIPGSAQYTPLGVPAVHYDNTEKIIGTWFGETLYEKSYEIDNISSQDTIIDNITNLNNIILFSGTFQRDLGDGRTRWYQIDGRTESSNNNNYGFCWDYTTNDDGFEISIYGYSVSEILKYRITIQYTKTV